MKIYRFIIGLGFVVGLFLGATSLRAEELGAAVEELAVEEPAVPAEGRSGIVEGLEKFLERLAERGVELDAGADVASLYECVARVADSSARLLDAAGVEHLQNERAGRDFYAPIRLTVSNAVPVVAGVDGELEGVQIGDRVLSIGGVSTTNATLSGALGLLRGHEAGVVELTLARGEVVVTASVERALSSLPVLELVEVWPREIGYAKVSGLVEGAGAGGAIVSLLREWAATNFAGAILDLRGADGGDVESAVAVASPFASAGALLFSLKDLKWNDVAEYRALDVAAVALPLMVLVDERTSGAAEMLAVAAEGLRGVLVIGEVTAGDPGIRDMISLDGGAGLYIATRQLVSGGGAVYDGSAGIVPTISVSGRSGALGFEPEPGPDRRAKLAEEATDRALRDRVRGDAALQRAVDVLLGLKALNIRAGAVWSGD